MNDNRWATIGRILTVFGTATALLLGLFELTDKFKTPSVYGIVEFQEDQINPRHKDMLKKRIRPERLKGMIDTLKKKNKTPNEIINEIDKLISDDKSDDRENILRNFGLWGVDRTMIVIQVNNEGANLAKSVKLIIPGEGKAIISEGGVYGLDAEPIDWSKTIDLGDIRPKGKLTVTVWPKIMALPSLKYLNPALVYSNGTGKLMEVQKFYGWDADLVAWFLSRSRLFRIGAFSFVIALIVSFIWIAKRRGHIVIKPTEKKHNT